jgi:hypothetical protein
VYDKIHTLRFKDVRMAHKTHLLFLGLPVTGIIISAFIVFTISYFFGYTFYLSVISFSVLLYLSPYIKRKGCILNMHRYPIIPNKVIISGLPEFFLSDIDEIIKNNQKVIVGLPLDRLLRQTIRQYVSEKYGLLEIVDSGNIVVGSEDLKITNITIISEKYSLDKKVDVLLNRGGWTKVGSPHSFVKGLTLKVSQNMEYKPL